jgi:hypothetical protein
MSAIQQSSDERESILAEMTRPSIRQGWRGFSAAPVIAVMLLAGCGPLPAGEDSAGARWPRPVSGRGCVERGGLPDARCTPGAIRSGVSIATICAYGYSRAVRPSESYTEPLKLRQMRAYGLPGSARDYEEDHLVALSIGGAPRDPANLWPEPRSGPYNAEQKDQLETWAARMACAGRIPLDRLQHEMAANWTVLYLAAGGERVLRSYPPGG